MSEEIHGEGGGVPADQVAPGPSTEGEEKKEESRLAGWASRTLRYLVAVGVVFALGVAVVWLMRVQPQMREIRDLSQSRDSIQKELTSAQSELDQLRPLKDQNAKLTSQLDEANRHLSLLSVLVDVTSAQLSLAQDQPLSAQAALKNTDSKMANLESGLSGTAATNVKGMRNRLGLIMNELQSGDRFAAQRDLEIVANTLVDLEKTLFGS
jgi:predicted negative regulator of RcsB-dependent stress response